MSPLPKIALFAVLASFFAPKAVAQSSFQVEISAEEAALGAGGRYWFTVSYSCSGGDCINPEIFIDPLSAGLLWAANAQGNDDFPRELVTGSTTGPITFRAANSMIAAGSSGQVRFTTGFPGVATCDGTITTLAASGRASGQPPFESNILQLESSAAHDSDVTIRRVAGGVVGQETIYEFVIRSVGAADPGYMGLFNAGYTVQLEPGVEYVTSSFDGVHDPLTNQVTWDLQTVGRQPGSSGASGGDFWYERQLTVRYGPDDFGSGDQSVLVGRLAGTGPESCASPMSSTESATFELVEPSPGATIRKYGGSRLIRGTETNAVFGINSLVTGNVPLEAYTITDTVLDEVDVRAVRTGRYVNATGVLVTVSFQMNDHPQWNSLGSYSPDGSTRIQFLPTADPVAVATGFDPLVDRVTKVRWEYGTVPVGFENATFYVGAVMEVWGRFEYPDGTPVEIGTTFRNVATQTYSYAGEEYQGTSSSEGVVVAPDPLIVTTSTIRNAPTLAPGNEIEMQVHVYNAYIGRFSGSELRDAVYRYPLPEVFVFEEVISQPQGFVFSADNGVLSWTIDENPLENTYFTVRLRVREGASGSHTQRIDVEGSNLYSLQRHPYTFEIVELPAVGATKQVQGSADADFTAPGGTAATAQGGPTIYRLTVRNTGNVALEDLTVVDLLPHVGDSHVLDASSARGSAWTPQLTGPIAAPSDVEIAYSISTDPCRTDLGLTGPAGCEDPAWTNEPPSPITSVRALRFTFAEALLPLEERVFDWPMVAPLGAPFDSQACNSFAYKARRADNGQQLLPAEPAAVCAVIEPLEPAALGDFVWEDANYNGLQDSTEVGINGVPVTLMKPVAGGEPVVATNRSGIAMQTVTADNADGEPGYYLFSDLAPGDYFIAVTLPEDKAFARSDGGDEERDSDVDPATGQSDAIALGPVELYTVDVGLRPPNSPPTAIAGEYAPQECLASSGTTVMLDGSASSDPDGDALTYTWLDAEGTELAAGATPTVTLPLGTHTITLMVADDKGASSTDETTVTVEDTTPPEISFSSSGLTLWPPNHKYHTIDLAAYASVSDQCDATLDLASLAITRVTSDEPEDARGGGDGKTTEDIVIGATCQTVEVRAERQGGGDGRVYTVFASASDAAGNTGSASLAVGVPRNKKSTAVDSGVAYTVDASCAVAGKGAPGEVLEPIPAAYMLGNYPNPFNPVTTIRYALPETEPVRLEVFDMMGRRVALLVDGTKEAGTHEVRFDSRGLSSGLYLYRMQTGKTALTGHMLLLK